MSKQESEKKVNFKGVTSFFKPLMILIIIVLIGVGFIYVINRDTFKDASIASVTYTGNATMSVGNGIVAEIKNEDGTVSGIEIDQIFNKIDGAETYLRDDKNSTKEEKLQYLMNAELVTKFPYISSLDGDDTKLNGVIKFYRYSNEIEAQEGENGVFDEKKDGKDSTAAQKFQLIYVEEDEFNEKLSKAQETENKDIFKYFTINEQNEIVIATWSKTDKKVETNDAEITAEKLTTESFTFNKTNKGVYTASKFTIVKTNLIDYNTLVKNYAMPFNLLWAFLVQTGDYSLTAEIARLAYESEICVGIYENEIISVSTNTEEYDKSIRYTENTTLDFSKAPVNISDSNYSNVVQYCHGSITENGAEHSYSANNRNDGNLYEGYITNMEEDGTISDIVFENQGATRFKTTETTTTVTATNPSIGVFYVDNWMATWKSNYKSVLGETKQSNSNGKYDNEEYKNISEDRISNALLSDSGLIGKVLLTHSTNLKQNAITEIENNTSVSGDVSKEDVLDYINSNADGQSQISELYGKPVSEMEERRTRGDSK